MTNFDVGIHFDVPHDVYHAGLRKDPKPLSSTLAKALAKLSPLEAKYEADNRVEKDAFNEGQLIHEYVLEGELKTIQVFDFDDRRGNRWKEAKLKAAKNGKVAMIERDAAPLREAAEAIRNHPEVAELLAVGDAEVSALVETNGIFEQARADHWRADGKRPVIVDVKTVAGTPNPLAFNREIAKFGYHIQAGMYQDVFRRIVGVEPIFVWVVGSRTAPYATSVIRASKATLETGYAMYAHAFGIYADCVRSGKWPAYDGISESRLPAHAEWDADEILGRTEVELKL